MAEGFIRKRVSGGEPLLPGGMYYKRNEFVLYTGGWINKVYSSSGSGGSYEKGYDNIRVIASTNLSNGECGIGIDKKIDFTDKDSLVVNLRAGYDGYYKITSYNWACYCIVRLSSTIKSGAFTTGNFTDVVRLRALGEHTIDVSGITGEYYLSLLAMPQGWFDFDKVQLL